MDIIADPFSYPPGQLEIILSQRPSSTPPLWEALDCRYKFIFSQLKDLPKAILFVSFFVFTKIDSLRILSLFFNTSIPKIRSVLSGLASVLNCLGDSLQLYHPSTLPEFLFTKERSGAYYIDPAEEKAQLCIISLTRYTDNPKSEHTFSQCAADLNLMI